MIENDLDAKLIIVKVLIYPVLVLFVKIFPCVKLIRYCSLDVEYEASKGCAYEGLKKVLYIVLMLNLYHYQVSSSVR